MPMVLIANAAAGQIQARKLPTARIVKMKQSAFPIETRRQKEYYAGT
jgi:hypothetical protein